MGEKPVTGGATKSSRFDRGRQGKFERGFILATSLVMLTLLTLLAIAGWFNARSAIQTSSTAQDATAGYYYAETAIHYLEWTLRNQVEFDSYPYTGAYVISPPFAEPALPPANPPVDPLNAGDKYELYANSWDPGPTAISDVSTPGTSGQIMYFDNTPLTGRVVRWPLPASGGVTVYPTLYHISASLPRYIRLDIDASGDITPEIPALPHHATPVIGQDIPENGAVAWLTAGNATTDFEIDATRTACSGTAPATATGCDKNSGQWIAYSVIVYAVGYVHGRAAYLVRAVII